MSRGRGGLGGMMHSSSRGSRRFTTFLFFASLLVFGALIPAWVITSEDERNDVPSAQLANLTEDELRGQELFAKRCSLCHTLKAANAVARVGPDLDAMAPPAALTEDAILKGRSQGNGQMPAELYTGQDAKDVANFVAKSVGAPAPSGG